MQKSPAMNRFSHNTKHLLAAQGMTQKSLADQLKIHPQNLSRSLKGSNSPSISFIQQVADILEVDICDLLAPVEESVTL